MRRFSGGVANLHMAQINKSFFALIAVVVILGFLGGVVGELWLNGFLLPDPYLSFKSYADLSHKIDELMQGQPRGKGLNQEDVAINEVASRVKPAIVKLYRYKKFTPAVSNSLLPGEFVGVAAIITNDGWLMTSWQNVLSEKGKFFAVTDDHRIFETSKIVAEKRARVVFLKIEANNLPVMEFSLRHDLVNGQAVLAFNGAGGLKKTSVQKLYYSELTNLNSFVHGSEDGYKDIQLSAAVGDEFLGSPVITLEGKMAGLILSGADRALPLDPLTAIMKATVQGEKMVRPYLGVSFYDLSEIMNPGITEARGAQIVAGGVKYDSPANGILLSRDIILKVENEELSAKKNLPELISQYHPGDSVKLLIKRDNQEKEVELKLGELSD